MLHIGPGVERLLAFFMVMLLIMHLVACFWLIAGYFKHNIQPTWLDGDLYESDNYDQYLASFYWAVQTVTTVGYGDTSISNNLEIIFGTVAMLVGSVCFSYS